LFAFIKGREKSERGWFVIDDSEMSR